MKHFHGMPFGAEVQQDGRVRFRLWAPAAARVELCLEGERGELRLPLSGEPEGWFSLVTERAASGSRYRYRIDGGLRVPDPASRFQPADIHGPSQVVDPGSWTWTATDWRGRPWEEAVIYELHLGSFTAEGDFAALQKRLDYLCELGVSAIELMPVADFPGRRNWGYDGVLPFAPDSSYGTPDAFKALIDAAHRRQLMVFLDVVYNHFGPEGNYLQAYAPDFVSVRHHTPWGAALNFDGPESRTVRQFFIHNALFWLEEYQLDGLRLDAVHALCDDSRPDLLEELAAAVRRGPGRERQIHLMLENDNNAAHYLRRDQAGRPHAYVAQWNDDLHHALHVQLTAETDGYYADYAERPLWYLGRCLTEGFAYQGEVSAWRAGNPRGEPSRNLPPGAFISFLQNHDQVGNRAFGERLSTLVSAEALGAAVALLLLAPPPPLLFMGEEFAARQPFLFFSHLGAELAAKVTAGRRREFARFTRFADAALRETIPDPNDPETFRLSKLDWTRLAAPEHQGWLSVYRELLALRQREIVPRLAGMPGDAAGFRQWGGSGLQVDWRLGDGSVLCLLANLSARPQLLPAAQMAGGELLYATPQALRVELSAALLPQSLPPWAVVWLLRRDAA